MLFCVSVVSVFFVCLVMFVVLCICIMKWLLCRWFMLSLLVWCEVFRICMLGSEKLFMCGLILVGRFSYWVVMVWWFLRLVIFMLWLCMLSCVYSLWIMCVVVWWVFFMCRYRYLLLLLGR